jgi:hypothetical protein
LTADEPLTGQLANLVDDLIVRAATMASPVVAPDSPAAPGLIDALGRVAGRASDRGERAVIGWTITPVTEALQALHGLLKDPGWQASRHAPRIRAALRQQLTDPRPVNRMLAAQALQLIEPAGPSRLALARQRLLAEPDAHIRAVLVFQLMSLVAEHAAAVDGLVAELDSSGSWPFASTSPAHGATTADEQSAVENDDDTLANQELVQATVLLVLRLAIQHQQAAAIRIVHRWFTDPVDHADLVHAAVDQLRKLGVLVPDREDSTATRSSGSARRARAKANGRPDSSLVAGVRARAGQDGQARPVAQGRRVAGSNRRSSSPNLPLCEPHAAGRRAHDSAVIPMSTATVDVGPMGDGQDVDPNPSRLRKGPTRTVLRLKLSPTRVGGRLQRGRLGAP